MTLGSGPEKRVKRRTLTLLLPSAFPQVVRKSYYLLGRALSKSGGHQSDAQAQKIVGRLMTLVRSTALVLPSAASTSDPASER